tara:strand:+ start:477 stop:1598 length:1122 start_codon:yes stop_codon:yes gene_type:complete
MALTLHGTVSDNTAVLDRRSAKPIIINGDMHVAQRATSVTSVTSSAYQTVDRFKFSLSSAGTWTVTQADDAPTGSGFQHSFKIDCTTADASLAASDFMTISTQLEGQDLQMFKKGTSSAEKMTISFWVKATKTGTNILEVDDNDNGRSISQAYTISSANTWEKKVLSFDADTTGAFDNDNASSLRLFWWLGAGSNYQSGTLATSWASTTNANRVVGQVNNADSTDNNWQITGIQLEVGDFDANSIAPFQHESYGDSLQRCQRYFQTIDCARTNAGSLGHVESSQVQTQLALAVTPRILAQYQGSGTLTKVGDIAINTFPSNADSITGVVNWMVLGNTLIFGMTTSDTIVNGSSEPVRYGSSNGQTIFTLDTEL